MANMASLSQRALIGSSGGGGAKWASISALARAPGVMNLGQGFPDFKCSEAATQGALACLEAGSSNQYSATQGSDRVRNALSGLYHSMYPSAGKALDPEKEICITNGGTEALFCAIMGLVDPGDEVVIFEPFFPWYLPHIKMAGGVAKPVTLTAPTFDLLSVEAELRSAFSSKTKLCIYNSPHNPTGHCGSPAELELLAELCKEFNVICVSDEVYEACTFTGTTHHRICDVDGMWERTLTIGSASKMFCVTGWRVGWATGPENLVAATKAMHTYATFCAPAPLQEGMAAAMEYETSGGNLRFDDRAQLMEGNWEILAAALRSTGVEVCPAQGGYFLVADVAATGKTDAEYVTWLATEHKVAAVPMNMFFCPREEGDDWCHLVRFAVCKERDYIERAAAAIANSTRSPLVAAAATALPSAL